MIEPDPGQANHVAASIGHPPGVVPGRIVNVRGDADLTRCSDDPQLAAACAQIVAADPRHIGDGLQGVFSGELQLSAT